MDAFRVLEIKKSVFENNDRQADLLREELKRKWARLLIAALAGFGMVKFFGVIFLGQPRDEQLAKAHDAGFLERVGLLWLAAGCVILGVIPNVVIAALEPLTRLLVDGSLNFVTNRFGWWLPAMHHSC